MYDSCVFCDVWFEGVLSGRSPEGMFGRKDMEGVCKGAMQMPLWLL
jgi:hypothetical protein